jgi:hypothetical protein
MSQRQGDGTPDDAQPAESSDGPSEPRANRESGSGSGRRAVGAVRARLEPVAGQRPLSVYGVLIIGVATLLVLLAVIYITATDQDQPPPICSTIDVTQAEQAIRAGEIERLTVVYDATERVPTSGRWGPVLARLEYANGQCANLPQGIGEQRGVLALIGLIDFYNTSAESQSVDIAYERQADLPAALFETPTPPPTATLLPTATLPPTAPSTLPGTPVEAETRVPAAPPTVTAPIRATPEASPGGTPRAGAGMSQPGH